MSQRGVRGGVLIALFLLPVVHAAAVVDAAPASARLEIEETIGFRETIKIGKWLPVTVTLKNTGPPVRGLLTVELSTLSEGYPRPYTTTLSQTVDLPTQSRKRHTFVLLLRDFTHPLVFRLTDRAGAEVYRREIDLRGLTSPDRLVLVLSDEPALDSLASVAPGKARIVHISPDELPTRWDALDAVDLLAFRNLSPGALRPEQAHAIRQWVARGGRLLVTGGPNWSHYTHPGLRELVPIRVTGLAEVTSLQALEPLTGIAGPTGVRVPILRAEPTGGRTLASDEGHTLIVADDQGRGQVVFVAFDPGRAPFTSWTGTAALWKALFPLDETPNYWQLRLSLRETFEETWIAPALQLPLLTFPSHLLLAVFLALYASTIGFFFWRLEVTGTLPGETWLLIALALGTFSVAAHLLFRERHIEQDAILFEISGVDVLPSSRFAEVETHVALLSTRKQAYDIHLAGRGFTWLQIVPPPVRELDLDWHLSHEDALTIKELWVPGWGLRIFKGKGMTDFPLQTRVLREADSVMIRVTNKTGFRLRDCWLWRGPRLVSLGDLDDGEDAEGTLTISPGEVPRGFPQARWEKDLAHDMFKGREIQDLLKRAIVERVMQEVLRGRPGLPNHVTFIAWLDRPPVAVSVTPGAIASHRATLVRMRLPL